MYYSSLYGIRNILYKEITTKPYYGVAVIKEFK
nr:MAG TPA: hypothetical protein [Caudoviricetes sp.]